MGGLVYPKQSGWGSHYGLEDGIFFVRQEDGYERVDQVKMGGGMIPVGHIGNMEWFYKAQHYAILPHYVQVNVQGGQIGSAIHLF